jgi:hypothetical protein
VSHEVRDNGAITIPPSAQTTVRLEYSHGHLTLVDTPSGAALTTPIAPDDLVALADVFVGNPEPIDRPTSLSYAYEQFVTWFDDQTATQLAEERDRLVAARARLRKATEELNDATYRFDQRIGALQLSAQA